MNSDIVHVALLSVDGELWFYKKTEQGFVPYRKAGTIVEGESAVAERKESSDA